MEGAAATAAGDGCVSVFVVNWVLHGVVLPTSPRAQAACRIPGSKPFLAEMKLVKNSPSLPPVRFPVPAWHVSC